MKQTIKYLILALLIPAAYCFTACDTDIEPIDQQIIKPDQQDPAQDVYKRQLATQCKKMDKKLLYKYINGQTSEQEEKTIVDWLCLLYTSRAYFSYGMPFPSFWSLGMAYKYQK